MLVRSFILSGVNIVRKLLNFFLWLGFLGFLLLFILEFYGPPWVNTLWLITLLRQWGNPVMAQANAVLKPPAVLKPFLPFGLALGFWGVQALWHSSMRWIHYRLALALPIEEPVRGVRVGGRVRPSSLVWGTAPLDSEAAREKLLAIYQDVEQALKSAKRKGCAFLSVDVVSSAEMKAGARDTNVVISFRAYERMLRDIFKEYGAWKQAWTPNGAMVCFLQRELAVAAAQRILQSLDHFNASYNRLRAPFRVRCGINEGEVRIYENTDLERFADRVVDVARHMQTQAHPNTLWVSGRIFAQLTNKSGFHPVETAVEGHKVYQWSLRQPVAEEMAPAKEAASATQPLGATPAGIKGAVHRVRRYEILEELGRGSMGVVYKARDPQIGRTVAIKVILTGRLSSEALEEYKQRFTREAQAAGQLSHPGIVTIHDIGEDEVGQPYLVMEFLEGKTLEAIELPLPNPLDIAIQLAEALDYAHRRGVIHRDLKPANIVISSDGRAKILDFGIAQLAGSKLTQAGQLLGTPAFMSPEQFARASVDSRSDIFSLGTLIYWMCTGKNPFLGESLAAVALSVMQDTAPPARASNPGLPAEIDVVLSRCMAKDSADRYPTGAALAADLKALKAGQPVSTPGPSGSVPSAGVSSA
jgi:tRNA A-37 threonylcarbamoyl transferase component Bud32/class 3 adenylate cyclase